MKIRELRQKSKDELNKFAEEKRNRLLTLRFDLAGGRVKNNREIRETKKDVAKVKTLIRESESMAKSE